MSLPGFHRLQQGKDDTVASRFISIFARRRRTVLAGAVVVATMAFLLINASLSFFYGDLPRGKPLVLEPLPPLQWWELTWPPPLNKPLCLPKIYVYPDDARMGEFQMKNIYMGTGYSSELILLDQLRDRNSVFYQSYVTTNPDEADFFLIPFTGANYLTYCWFKLGRSDDCEVERLYMTPMMDHIQNDHPYWNRSHGADHIMIHPMDMVSLYYKTTRDRFANATFLATIGDKRHASYASHKTRRYQDIIIPSATLILDVAKVNPADYVDAKGWPRTARRRDVFAVFAGIYDNVNRTDQYSNGIRALLHEGIDKLPGYHLSPELSNGAYADLLARSKYGLAPQGWTLDTTRIWEYLAFGVVPVVIADGITEPFEDDIDWDSFIVRIRRSEAHRLDAILRAIPLEEYERKRRAVWDHGRQMLFNHDAWHLIVRQLCRKREDLAEMQTVAGGQHMRIDFDHLTFKTSMFP